MFLSRRKSPYAQLEKVIGYRFRKTNLIEMALTHRSYRFEKPEIDVDNQRLEFLGDAVLGHMTAAYLYAKHSGHDEGGLTALRSQVTNGRALAEMAASIQLGSHLRLGRGEEKTGGRGRPAVLADALEALIGAAYIDGGMKGAEAIFKKLVEPEIGRLSSDLWADNPKGCLQDVSQRRFGSAPRYKVLSHRGPAHESEFTVQVLLNGEPAGVGCGGSKREAEAKAAMDALRRLEVKGVRG